MYNDVFEQWMKNSKNMSMPLLNNYTKAATDAWQHMFQLNLEIMSDSFARTADQIKRVSHVKKPEDLINLQKEIVTENIHAAVENMQNLLRTTTENVESFSDLCGSCHEQSQSAASARSPEKSAR